MKELIKLLEGKKKKKCNRPIHEVLHEKCVICKFYDSVISDIKNWSRDKVVFDKKSIVMPLKVPEELLNKWLRKQGKVVVELKEYRRKLKLAGIKNLAKLNKTHVLIPKKNLLTEDEMDCLLFNNHKHPKIESKNVFKKLKALGGEK